MEKSKESLFHSPKRETTVDLVINAIKKALLTQRLKPGDRLPSETDLAKSFSVSRGSVREAMKILSALGIVDIFHGDGTYINASAKRSFFGPLFFSLITSNAEARQLVELREMIELGVFQSILRNASEEDLLKIEEAYLSMENTIKGGEADVKILAQYDIDFHYALGRATKNDLIEKIYHFVLEYFAPLIEKIQTDEELRSIALRLHHELVLALKGRNLERAERAIKSFDKRWIDLF